MHKHRIILENFDLEEGKISFSKLKSLQDKLTALAEGAVLSLVEGRSKPGRGQKPQWLRGVLDFQITGLNSGSTILEIEAPEISQFYKNKQYGMFDEPEAKILLNESAFGLVSYVARQAMSGHGPTPLLDKYLLQRITAFDNVLDNNQSTISLISNGQSRVKSAVIKKKTLKKVSITEQKVREPVKTSITGILDVMRHAKSQMEIVTGSEKRIRAFPGNNIPIKNLTTYFGERVKITGLVHFKTDANLKYIEILDIQKQNRKETVAEELTLPIFEDIDLKRLAKEQEWQGFNEKKFKQTIKEMKVQESPEELLELLKE